MAHNAHMNHDLAHSWDVIERASRGDKLTGERLFGMSSSAFRRRFASEITQGKTEWQMTLHDFTDEIASLEGAEAIYWEKYLIGLVRVSRIRVSDEYVKARVDVVPRVSGEHEGGWRIGCEWPSFHSEELLWTSQCQGARWRIFFARPVAEEVMRIQSSFPSTDKFEPYDHHYFALVQPLEAALAEKALGHVRALTEQLDSIEVKKTVSRELRTTLATIVAAVQSYPDGDAIGKLLTFIGEVENQADGSLTNAEAGQFIRTAYLIGRTFGGPF